MRSESVPNYYQFSELSRDRIVVSTSRCGRDNPGSNPGHGIGSSQTTAEFYFYNDSKKYVSDKNNKPELFKNTLASLTYRMWQSKT